MPHDAEPRRRNSDLFRELVAAESAVLDLAGLIDALTLLDDQLEPSPERSAFSALHGICAEKTSAISAATASLFRLCRDPPPSGPADVGPVDGGLGI